jgi:hypothetical protein
MKRIYIILPRKIDSKPPLMLTCGIAMAQIHHASIKASKSFNISVEDTVVILQVPGSMDLLDLSNELFVKGIRFAEYWEESVLFEGIELTAVVTEPTERLEMLDHLPLWNCD